MLFFSLKKLSRDLVGGLNVCFRSNPSLAQTAIPTVPQALYFNSLTFSSVKYTQRVHVHTHCVYNQAAIGFYLKPSGNTVDTSSHNTHSACNWMKKHCVPEGRHSASVRRDKTTPRRDLTEQHDNTEAGNGCIGIKKIFRNSSEAVFLLKRQV